MIPSLEIPRGTSLGKYEILRKLATGGMAEIYLARVRGIVGFEKLVVLKRILPTVAEDPNFVQMFLDEARLAATLQHPNIADVYDVGSDAGTYFFTMEFVHGEDARTLRIETRKREEVVPLPHALAIVHGTASALDYAHNKSGPQGPLGLVHRDVSSSNILVSFDGAVKLVDFGIARATSRQSKTRTGTLKGKIPYMSPEQCQNRPLDRRSDLFSLGVVLYELTVGRRPFRGDSDFAILDQIVNRGAPRPSSIVQNYPPDLETIVMKALARPAAERYQNGEAMLHDLELFMTKHGAWVSPIALGRYMRSMFADKIAAWEQAEEKGASLGEYVAKTITSESLRQERMTPVSAFTAQPELPEPAAPTTILEISGGDLVPVVPVLPTLRRSRTPLWLGLAGIVAAAVVILVVATRSGGGDPKPSAPPPERAVVAPVQPDAAAAPVAPVAPVAPPPTVTPPAPVAVTPPAKPAVKQPKVDRPKAEKPKAKPPGKEPTWDPNSISLPN